MLAEFAQRFESTKTGLHSLITHRTAKLVEKTSGRIDEVAASVSELVKFMDIQTSRERETAALVATNGGTEAVLKVSICAKCIDQALNDIRMINSSMKSPKNWVSKLTHRCSSACGKTWVSNWRTTSKLIVCTHIAYVLTLHSSVFFDIKMQAVQEQITEAINRSTSTILLKVSV